MSLLLSDRRVESWRGMGLKYEVCCLRRDISKGSRRSWFMMVGPPNLGVFKSQTNNASDL